MEPRIQYATAPDGASIAFWTVGHGPPIVELSMIPISHIQMEWGCPEFRRWFERIGRGRTLVRLDPRGCGLSSRDATDYSLEAQVLDVKAVVDKLGLAQFTLFGMFNSGPVAIAYAALSPNSVGKLILWSSYARFADVSGAPRIAAARAMREALADVDWDLFSDMWAHLLGSGGSEEHHRWFTTYIRESAAQDTLHKIMEVVRAYDVRERLSAITCPTLIIHRRQLRFADVGANRTMASLIPDARLALLEGTSFLPYLEDTDAVVEAIDDFLQDAPTTKPLQAPTATGFRTILFTDIEGHTSMMDRLGDVAGRAVLREHEHITREALRVHGGTEVKTQGDGFMASFATATSAVECAIAIQRAFRSHNATAREQLLVRVGLNAGEPIAEGGDYFGAMVIVASRIAAQARGGDIVASNVVRELCAGKRFLFSDRGETVLRGFEDAVRLFDVSWRQAD